MSAIHARTSLSGVSSFGGLKHHRHAVPSMQLHLPSRMTTERQRLVQSDTQRYDSQRSPRRDHTRVGPANERCPPVAGVAGVVMSDGRANTSAGECEFLWTTTQGKNTRTEDTIRFSQRDPISPYVNRFSQNSPEHRVTGQYRPMWTVTSRSKEGHEEAR